MNERLARVTTRIAAESGSTRTFAIMFGLIVIWAISGPFLGFSAAWMLIVNTVTTIVSFLLLFIIQGTQNHDQRATSLKLDEIIHAIADARDDFIGLERATEADLAAKEQELHGGG